MKKLLLAFFLYVSVVSTASAPPIGALPIFISNPIDYYTPLIEAIYQHETRCDSLAVNVKEGAFGGLQIRMNRLEHYNKLNNTNYTLRDCLSMEISKKIFRYFTNHDSKGNVIPSKTWERAAKNWNGSGPLTIIYWEKVKNLI